jgi:lysozyme
MSVKARVITGGAVVVTGSLVAFVAHWEGTEYVPYRDVVGVWTVCEGITGKHVIPGKTYTRKDCDALLSGELEKHGRGLLECVKVPMPQHRYEALASWTFNVGVGAACGSTLVRRLNSGESQIPVCNELLRWNRAGGKEVRGLTNRRQAEFNLCRQP